MFAGSVRRGRLRESDASREGASHAMTTISVEELAATLARGETAAMSALFRENGSRVPFLLWSPSLVDVQHPVSRSVLRACGGQTPVAETFLDSEDFAALAEWTMVVEMIDDGADTRYRHYGAGIAESYGRDLTGMSVADVGGHVATFFHALYIAAATRNEIVKSVHEPPKQVFVTEWRRLLVPLTAPDGKVRRFAVANVPDNPLRAGLDMMPDPVLIVSQDGRVCCANRAACLRFQRARCVSGEDLLVDWIGGDVALPPTPDDLILSGAPHHVTARSLRAGKIVALRATIGATYYRDQAFFVVHLQDAKEHTA